MVKGAFQTTIFQKAFDYRASVTRNVDSYEDFKVEIESIITLTNIEKVQRDELNPVNTTLLVTGGVLLVAGGILFIEIANALSR